MTEEEKMRWFLLRASTVVGDRVQHFDDILEEKFFKALESLFFEKDNPLETKDEEFENVFRFVTEALDRGLGFSNEPKFIISNAFLLKRLIQKIFILSHDN